MKSMMIKSLMLRRSALRNHRWEIRMYRNSLWHFFKSSIT